MGMLHPDDEDLHYCDSSHRWACPTAGQEEQWRLRMQGHIAAHQDSPDPGHAPRAGLGPGRPAGTTGVRRDPRRR